MSQNFATHIPTEVDELQSQMLGLLSDTSEVIELRCHVQVSCKCYPNPPGVSERFEQKTRAAH